jgi:hypothetical protein
MIKMKRILVLVTFATTVLSLNAQNEVDALRYSRLSVVGTARFSGLGGAFGALGADFSSLSINPAGIGLYRSSEFSLTPSLNIGSTQSVYLGDKGEDSRTNFSLGNVGFISVVDGGNPKSSSIRKVMFGFGINRVNSFNNRAIIKGFPEVRTNNYSLLSVYADQAHGNTSGQLSEDSFTNVYGFEPGMAKDADLIYSDSTGKVYYADMPYGGFLQRETIKSWGSMNEMELSMGANILEKFYIGATVGVPFVRYFEETSYTEDDTKGNNGYFKSFTRTESINTTGTGVNFKLGIIYKPVEFIRLGAAIHTPTYFDKMSDAWSSKISSYFDDGATYQVSSPKSSFDYSLTTPFRAIGSVAFIFGKFGLVSTDYEFVDYSDARLSPIDASGYSFDNENDAIRFKYRPTGNLRIGTEWKYAQFSFRGGYGIEGDPYKSGINNSVGHSYSLGMGVREKDYFVDMAYVHSKRSEDYYMYDPSYVEASRNTIQSNNLLLTFGVRF